MARIKWKNKGFRQLRKSNEVLEELEKRAEKIADRAGPGVETSPFIGRNRARVSVITVTEEARRANAEQNTLLRAVDAGR